GGRAVGGGGSGSGPVSVRRRRPIGFPTAGLVTRPTGPISCFGLAALDDLGVLGLDRGLLLGGKFGSAQDVTSWNAPEIFTPMISGFGGRRADFNCVPGLSYRLVEQAGPARRWHRRAVPHRGAGRQPHQIASGHRGKYDREPSIQPQWSQPRQPAAPSEVVPGGTQ